MGSLHSFTERSMDASLRHAVAYGLGIYKHGFWAGLTGFFNEFIRIWLFDAVDGRQAS